MAKVLMTARQPIQQGDKLLVPGDTFAAKSIGEAKRLMRQNLARPKPVITAALNAALNRAMEARRQGGSATGKYRTK
jgi:hypothetical protein